MAQRLHDEVLPRHGCAAPSGAALPFRRLSPDVAPGCAATAAVSGTALIRATSLLRGKRRVRAGAHVPEPRLPRVGVVRPFFRLDAPLGRFCGQEEVLALFWGEATRHLGLDAIDESLRFGKRGISPLRHDDGRRLGRFGLKSPILSVVVFVGAMKTPLGSVLIAARDPNMQRPRWRGGVAI
jgi:hypothetical protein